MKLIYNLEILSVRPFILFLKLLRNDLDEILFWRSALTYISTDLSLGYVGHYLPSLRILNSFQPSYGNCSYSSLPVITSDTDNLQK
jgi:hypothetical protein